MTLGTHFYMPKHRRIVTNNVCGNFICENQYFGHKNQFQPNFNEFPMKLNDGMLTKDLFIAIVVFVYRLQSRGLFDKSSIHNDLIGLEKITFLFLQFSLIHILSILRAHRELVTFGSNS